MSTEGATALFERVSNDDDFRRRLEEAPTAEDRRRVVTEAGLDVDRDDLATIKSLGGLDELSDEDLAQAVGGMGGWILAHQGRGEVLGPGALAAAAVMSMSG